MLLRLLTAALIALPALLGAARAEAAIVSGTVTFSVPATGPINPFTGSFDITFDNSANISTDTTAGLSNVVLPLVLSAGVPGFQYYVDFGGTPDVFVLGGTQNGVGSVSSGTTDFYIAFRGISTGTLAFFAFAYADGDIFQENGPATLTFTPAQAAVPAPAALALFGVGLLALAGLRRRAG